MTARTLTVALTVCICLLLATSSAFAAAPAYKLTAGSVTTDFVAGADPTVRAEETPFSANPIYNIVATNIGSAPTSGPIVLTDTLPDGLTPVLPAFRFFDESGNPEGTETPCSISGQTVLCTDAQPLASGRWAQFAIPVKVAGDAASSVLNKVSILGGGAAEAVTTTTTTITPEVSRPSLTSCQALVGSAPRPSALMANLRLRRAPIPMRLRWISVSPSFLRGEVKVATSSTAPVPCARRR